MLDIGMSRNANMKGSEIKSPYFGFKPELSIGQGNSTLTNFFAELECSEKKSLIIFTNNF